MTNPVQAVLADRVAAVSLFENWCRSKGACAVPALPAVVAAFAADTTLVGAALPGLLAPGAAAEPPVAPAGADGKAKGSSDRDSPNRGSSNRGSSNKGAKGKAG